MAPLASWISLTSCWVTTISRPGPFGRDEQVLRAARSDPHPGRLALQTAALVHQARPAQLGHDIHDSRAAQPHRGRIADGLEPGAFASQAHGLDRAGGGPHAVANVGALEGR